MKTIRCLAIISLLLITTSTRCFALWEIEDSTKERAKELGIEITTKMMNATEVGAWLEFKPKGKLEKFSCVGLEITSNGKKVVSANVLPSRKSEDIVTVPFYTDLEFLPACKVTVYVWSESGRGGIGYRFNVKDIAKPMESK
jgi:hypothetical protein